MSTLKVVCTEQTDWNSQGHGRIIAIGTGDSAKATKRWTVAETWRALDQGHVFYLVSPTTGAVSLVKKHVVNGIATLRSESDGVPDNNLDNLRGCQFAA